MEEVAEGWGLQDGTKESAGKGGVSCHILEDSSLKLPKRTFSTEASPLQKVRISNCSTVSASIIAKIMGAYSMCTFTVVDIQVHIYIYMYLYTHTYRRVCRVGGALWQSAPLS